MGITSEGKLPGQVNTKAQHFETFMRNYQDMVYSTAMRLVANSAEAEDISQEVFLKAYERFGELSQSPTAGGWLKTVATNMSLNHLSRYRSRWRFFSELLPVAREEDENYNPLDMMVEQGSQDDFARMDQQELVQKGLEALPAAQRVPLVLFHLEGMGYEEIAAKLGVSLGKVKTDIFRGRQALKKKLGAAFAEEYEVR